MNSDELAVLRTLHANERTFLAWCRTCVALLAFGFVLEKFRFFTRYINLPAPKSLDKELSVLGVGMFVAGLVLLAVATWRFIKTRKRIMAETCKDHPRSEPILAYAAMAAILALILIIAFYMLP